MFLFLQDGSLSALAVGHALMLHLQLAAVPLLSASVSGCCHETRVGARWVGWDGGMGWWDGMGVGARGVDGGKGRCFEMTKIAGIFQVGKVGVMRTSLI